MNDTTFQGNGKVAYVPVVVNAKPPKPTNADRIRAMTDEELAHAFVYQCAGRVCRGILFDGPNECENCWLDWLKKEAAE